MTAVTRMFPRKLRTSRLLSSSSTPALTLLAAIFLPFHFSFLAGSLFGASAFPASSPFSLLAFSLQPDAYLIAIRATGTTLAISYYTGCAYLSLQEGFWSSHWARTFVFLESSRWLGHTRRPLNPSNTISVRDIAVNCDRHNAWFCGFVLDS